MAFLTDEHGALLADEFGDFLTDEFGALGIFTLVLTVVGHGAAFAIPGQDEYVEGTRIVLTTAPDPGNVLLYWSLNGSHFFTPTLTINIGQDLAVIARFATLAETTTTAPDRARCPFCHGTPGCVVCGGTGWVRA